MNQMTKSPFTVVVAGLAVAVSVLIGYPILKVLAGLIWVDGHFTMDSFRATTAVPDFAKTLFDTGRITIASGVLALLIGSIFAWLNERTDARMGVVTDVLPIVNFLMPIVAGAVGWVFLLSPNAGYLNWLIREVLSFVGVHLEQGPLEAYTWYSVIFVYTLSMVPFVFLVMTAGIRNIDPSIEEQSRVCGAGKIKTLFKVTLPSLKGSIFSAMFLITWFGLSVFSIPTIMADPAGIQLLSVRIVKLLVYTYPSNTGAATGLGAIIMITLGIVWLLQQKTLRAGRMSVLSGKSARASRIQLGRLRIVARAFMILYMALAVIAPLVALLLVALNGFWTTDINWGGLNLNAFRTLFEDSSMILAIKDSVILASATATVGMMIASCLAWMGARIPGLFARITGAITKIPAAVSTVVIGVGFILAFAGPPFMLGGTVIILFMAYIVVSMPEGAVVAEAAVGQVGAELGEASQVSGAKPIRTFISIYLPLMLPGLAAGWALVFVRIIGDLEASALLASTATPTIGYQLLGIFNGGGGYDTLAALALVVTVISTVILSFTLTLSARFRKVKR